MGLNDLPVSILSLRISFLREHQLLGARKLRPAQQVGDEQDHKVSPSCAMDTEGAPLKIGAIFHFR